MMSVLPDRNNQEKKQSMKFSSQQNLRWKHINIAHTIFYKDQISSAVGQG